jgi:hypothetical protein
MKRKTGCLISVLGMVFAFAAFVGLVAPAISGASRNTGSMRIGSNGRQIHLAIFGAALDAECSTDSASSQSKAPSIWPVDGQYASSTEFLKATVANEWLQGVDFTFFRGPGLDVSGVSTNPASFGAEHNAWGVVTLPATPEGGSVRQLHSKAPFLFSKNIGFGTPPGPPWEGATTADMSGLIRGAKPFGKKVGVIVTFGGSVKVLPAKLCTQENINPSGAALKVLMP